jgi:hypothetical protein
MAPTLTVIQIINGSLDAFTQQVADTVDDVHSQLRDLGTSTIMGLAGNMLTTVQDFVESMLIH